MYIQLCRDVWLLQVSPRNRVYICIYCSIKITPKLSGLKQQTFCLLISLHSEAKEWEIRRGPARQKLQAFCNLILEVASHHSCCILFIRDESLDLAHTQGEGITQGHKHKEARMFREHFRGCLARNVGWGGTQNPFMVCLFVKNCHYGFNSSSFFP